MKNIKYKIEDEYIINTLEKEKQDLNIKRNIKLFKVNGLSSPALIGFINHKIILPKNCELCSRKSVIRKKVLIRKFLCLN